jgi:hypothetical protein
VVLRGQFSKKMNSVTRDTRDSSGPRCDKTINRAKREFFSGEKGYLEKMWTGSPFDSEGNKMAVYQWTKLAIKNG